MTDSFGKPLAAKVRVAFSQDGFQHFETLDVEPGADGRLPLELDASAWVVVSGDGRILKNHVERSVLEEAGLVWIGPEHLKQQYGGWPFKPDVAWLNLQTIATHHFKTLIAKQGFVGLKLLECFT